MGMIVTDVGLETSEQGMHEIKKHAAAIHCSNASSLLQRKISNALLYHAYKELLLKDEHAINIKQLCNLISYSGNNHAVIKEALKGLLSTVIEWNLVNDKTGQEDWTASSILASVSLQGPVCLYAYSPRMKQLMHSPSMFGKINLFIQSRFKSSYGLALYENCVRYRGLSHTKWFEMDLFRKLMGVPSGKYMIFRDFKRRVLDKSVEEVNMYSDVVVEAELYREGRQVVKLRFIMKDRAKKVRLGGEKVAQATSSAEIDTKTKLIEQYGLLNDQCEQLFIEYGVDVVTEKLVMIESSPNYLQGRVKNLAAYLLSALKNNYQQPKKSNLRIVSSQQAMLDHSKSERIAEQLRAAYQDYKEQTIDVAINNLVSLDKEKFYADFYCYAADTIETILKLQRNKYNKQTILQSPQIKVLLRKFALQELTVLKTELISLEQFIADKSDVEG